MNEQGLKPFIGITGGIGSGKSTICRIFSILGIPVFEADVHARNICDQDPEVKAAIWRNLDPEPTFLMAPTIVHG